jgi:hypothetical protein
VHLQALGYKTISTSCAEEKEEDKRLLIIQVSSRGAGIGKNGKTMVLPIDSVDIEVQGFQLDVISV